MIIVSNLIQAIDCSHRLEIPNTGTGRILGLAVFLSRKAYISLQRAKNTHLSISTDSLSRPNSPVILLSALNPHPRPQEHNTTCQSTKVLRIILVKLHFLLNPH